MISDTISGIDNFGFGDAAYIVVAITAKLTTTTRFDGDKALDRARDFAGVLVAKNSNCCVLVTMLVETVATPLSLSLSPK